MTMANNKSGHHPASVIDVVDAARVFALSLTGKGPHWDSLMIEMHPKMADAGTENACYVMDNCIEMGLCEEEPEPGSKEEARILTLWCERRAPVCKKIKESIAIHDGHILAHRIIDSHPDELLTNLGLFWSHDFANWCDPTTPWGKGRGKSPTLVIEAMVPVEAIDWQMSCLAHMDWMIGDAESELRVKPGYYLRNVKANFLANGKEIRIPEQKWET